LEQREYTTSDGVRLVADVAGAPGAPTVILLHGGGQTRHSWSKFMAALAAAGYHAINYDARGHGDSSWSPDGEYSYRARAADLETIARGVAAGNTGGVAAPCALVGASMGGITALQAVSDGYRAGALVLVDIVLRPELAGVRRIRDFMLQNPDGFASLEEAADAVAAYNPERPRSATPDGLARNLRPGPKGRLYWHWDPRILPASTVDVTLHEQFLAQLRLDQRLPTLLIRGMRSDIVSDANVAEFRRLLPSLEVANVAAAGHMIAGDDNDVFNRSAIDFLRRVFPVDRKP
jgi:pimeloyl-ACP methyl ester carboxylesterase